jgi:UDP-3-O-[3-hydroxymyristoyl] N-acetylglucosamine deacetylase
MLAFEEIAGAAKARHARKRTRIKPMTPRFDKAPRQTTLGGTVALSGRGAHSDTPARLRLSPAGAGTGIVFAPAKGDRPLEARWTKVCSTRLRTEIACGALRVSTIEHLMAALSGMGVDNALIELDGPEVPAMDGSAREFVAAIADAGVVPLKAPRRILKIVAPMRVTDGPGWAELGPSKSERLDLDVEIFFSGVGRQRLALPLLPQVFAREIAPARSFGFVQDAERLWRQGLALGATLENSVVLDDGRVLNPEGLRFSNELARHKMLDAIGDLALAGAPVQGVFRSCRGGHGLNLALIGALMQTPAAYAWIGGEADRGFGYSSRRELGGSP